MTEEGHYQGCTSPHIEIKQGVIRILGNIGDNLVEERLLRGRKEDEMKQQPDDGSADPKDKTEKSVYDSPVFTFQCLHHDQSHSSIRVVFIRKRSFSELKT